MSILTAKFSPTTHIGTTAPPSIGLDVTYCVAYVLGTLIAYRINELQVLILVSRDPMEEQSLEVSGLQEE